MSGWIDTYRGTVYRWEVDHNDHFTVAYYFTRFADAGLALLDAIGLGEKDPAGRRGRFVTAACYVRYLAELRAGDIMHVTSGVIRVGADDLVLGHKLFDSDGGRLCATVEQRLLRERGRPVPAGTRRATSGGTPAARAAGSSLTAAQRRAAEARLVEWDGPPRERRPAPDGDEGFTESARDTVKPWEIETSGAAALSSYIHRFSAANGHTAALFGMTPAYQRTQRRGFSTFEFQLEILAPLRAGDLVRVRSALVHVGTSSVRIFHKMLDGHSGEPRATLEQFGVHLDMDARRPTPLPDALRDKARALLVPTVG